MTDLQHLIQEQIRLRHLTANGELHNFRQQLITQINQFFTEHLTGTAQPLPLDRISASQVTIEVIDEASGRIFRRQLPLDYFENDNGIRLRGETINGQETEIAFLSAKAMAKMHDLTGKGADTDHCGGHSPDGPAI